jgi:hypothetical protein
MGRTYGKAAAAATHYPQPIVPNTTPVPDEDAQNNRQEWIGGSNPTNKLSAFAITSGQLSPGGSNIVIHWPTLPGRVYDMLWSASATGPFLPLGSNLPHTQTDYADTTAPPSGFYRVNVRLE